MSRQNVERTYRAHELFNQRDLAALVALFDPGVEFVPYEVSVEGGEPYRGHEGVRGWCRNSWEVLPDLRSELYEVRDLGRAVLVHGCLRGRGAGSGAAVERTLWQVVEWLDGKVVWWQAFASEADALEAVGLRA